VDSLWEGVKDLAGQYAERGVVPPEEEAEDQVRRLARGQFTPEPPPQAVAFYARELRIMAAEMIAAGFDPSPERRQESR